MIDEIHVENLALIRNATLTPCAGLTVLTGETGAGKTALLSACKLLMGERASAQMVRDGEDSLVVSGRFFVRESAGEGADADAIWEDAPAVGALWTLVPAALVPAMAALLRRRRTSATLW